MKLQRIFVALGFLTVASLPTIAMADNSVGCGLGSMIFKDNTLLSSTSRVTTNNLFLNQYFGVTSGTSGCTRHDIVMNEKSHIHYAEVNLEQLSLEMAKGDGQFVSTFAMTLGCSDAVTPAFNKMTKQNYENIFTNENVKAADMLKNLGTSLRQDKNLTQNCSKAFLI